MGDKAYGFIYITTNLINGKKYIGQRRFSQNWVNYLGSGVVFIKALKKYGKQNFHREIVAIAYSKKELDCMEVNCIKNYDAINDANYYNIAEGGSNGNNFLGKSEKEMQIIRQKMSTSSMGELNSFYGKSHSKETIRKLSSRKVPKETRIKMSENHADVSGENNPMYNKSHSEETKMKISETRVKNGIGKGSRNTRARQVICTTTNKVFDYIGQASEFYGCTRDIGDVCRGKRNYCGTLTDGTPLKWMFYDEYLLKKEGDSE